MDVLIVDDDDDFRRSAHELLAEDGFNVVGEAADGAATIEAVRRLHPGVVLLDVQLLDSDGFAVAQRISQEEQAPVVVLTSVRGLEVYRRRLASSPAIGFIAKADLSGAALADLIHES